LSTCSKDSKEVNYNKEVPLPLMSNERKKYFETKAASRQNGICYLFIGHTKTQSQSLKPITPKEETPEITRARILKA